MAKADDWATIHAERKALVADLEPLTDAQWATPSLAGEWSVRDVLAHMLATAKMTPPKFFAALAGSGFSFSKFTAKGVANNRGQRPADTLDGYRSELSATTHPPGPLEAMIGEAVVHSTDIRRPLGISHTFPPDTLAGVADFYKGSNLLIGGKKRVAGLTLRASDTGWSSGSGPEVSGPMLSLVMAIAGRRAVLDDLSGDGLATLKARG
jgi:uncharacterized protein (TIGR03083 family)